MKVNVQLARSQREYSDVIVEAPSVEVAEQYVEMLINVDDNRSEYWTMLDNTHWNTGDDVFDEEVIDAEEHGRQDVEADVTVPADWAPPVEAPPDAKTIDDATKARRYDHILTLLQFENGEHIELNSCADFVQDVTLIMDGAYDDREPAWQEPEDEMHECPSCAGPLTAGDRTIGTCPRCGSLLGTEGWKS